LRAVPIPYGRQSIDEDDIAAVADVLRGDWLTQGPAVAAFEQSVADVCDVPFAVAFSSGTAALHGAAFAAGVGPGDELVTSALTFSASANCGAYLGATARFADISPDTLNVTAESVAGQVSERTRAVVPVHFTGLPAPIADVREAVGDDVAIVEDAAHALGSVGPDGPAGNCAHSDMAVFSFHPVKTIAAGEGGMVTTRDEALRDRLLSFRNHGFAVDPATMTRNDGGWYREQHDLGFNYRLSDIHSALGRSQMRKLDAFVARRNAVVDRYREAFAGFDELTLPPEVPPGQVNAYHLFVIRVRGGAPVRRRLYDELRERGIYAQVHYLPVYLHPWYRERFGYGEGLCPNAEAYYDAALSLPCFPTLSEADQDTVVDSVKEILSA
jgi:UDP-4-amino-4,6-dideoxy-N-acetyl-beta-L-altrosamine transaminase